MGHLTAAVNHSRTALPAFISKSTAKAPLKMHPPLFILTSFPDIQPLSCFHPILESLGFIFPLSIPGPHLITPVATYFHSFHF